MKKLSKAAILALASALLITGAASTAYARTITIEQGTAKQVFGSTKPGSQLCNDLFCYTIKSCKNGKCAVTVTYA